MIMLKSEIINDSNSNKLKIFFGEAPTILSKAISCLLLFRFEYKIVIRPISDVKITIEDIDSIIFSVTDTICHNFERAIPGITA